jgi:hypothetical protein
VYQAGLGQEPVVVEAKGKFFVAVKAMVSFPPKTYATAMMFI